MNYYQLQPALLVCDFNFEMIMTIKTVGSNQLNIDGNFRTISDFGGLRWKSEDEWGHPAQKYDTVTDFSGVILSYTYSHEGAMMPMDAVSGQSLTVEMTDGTLYHVRMWNYVVDRPVQDWEAGGGILFPAGRTPGNATGSYGHVVIGLY